jgi:hypothetical protein
MIDSKVVISPGSVAVYLMIPTQWLRISRLTKQAESDFIDNARTFITPLGDGIFARVLWSAYFCIVTGDITKIADTLRQKIDHLCEADQRFKLWIFSAREVSGKSTRDVWDAVVTDAKKMSNSLSCPISRG